MENKLATLISKRFLKMSIITEKYFEVYVYGLELVLSFIFTSVIILTIGVVCNQFVSALIFISVFVLLRRFTGGYHADTHLKCKLWMAGLYIVNMILTIYLPLNYVFFIVLCIIGLIFVCIFSPIENKYKPIELHRRPKIKIISIIIYILISTLGIVMHFKFETSSNAVFYALMSVVALMFIQKIKERRVHAHEDDFQIGS